MIKILFVRKLLQSFSKGIRGIKVFFVSKFFSRIGMGKLHVEIFQVRSLQFIHKMSAYCFYTITQLKNTT